MFKKCAVVVASGVLMLLAANVEAKTNYFDSAGLLVMKSGHHTPKLYQIFNTSGQKVNMDVDAKPVGVQAGYGTSIDPHNASAFIYGGAQPPLSWVCQVSASASTAAQKVPCDKVLKVSNYPAKRLKLGTDVTNHWLLENKPQTDFAKLLKSTLEDNHLLNAH